METLDLLYKALVDSKNQEINPSIKTQNEHIKKANIENDLINVTSYVFNIESDWIEAIEKGLEHVKKAIDEERQFIRTNGEVVPIEKAKRVSRASVAHLARHSNLITKKVEGEDIIPDKIFMVEKLSDYAVYENRFLYMLLCYLRDFISIRYDKIVEYAGLYTGKLNIDKTINSRYSNMKVSINFEENKKNDPFARKKLEQLELIGRIDDLLSIVNNYLECPLMMEVSKTPMIKPPITKTNVLKMNKNFKGAVALYDFVCSYTQDGYEIKEVNKKINPFGEQISQEFASLITMISFLTYKNGNNLEKTLEKNYLDYLDQKKLEDQKDFEIKVKHLKAKLARGEISPEEYIVTIETQLKKLSYELKSYIKTKEENELLKEQVTTLSSKVNELQERVDELEESVAQKEQQIQIMITKHQEEIDTLNQNHLEEVQKIHADYQDQILKLNEEYSKKKKELVDEYEEKIEAINKENLEKLNNLEIEHQEKIKSLQTIHDNEKDDLNVQIQMMNEDLNKQEKEFESKLITIKQSVIDMDGFVSVQKEAINEVNNQKLLLLAEMNALRAKYKLIPVTEDFTSEYRFKELEKEYEIFKSLFKTQWRKTKKVIKKQVKQEYEIKKNEKKGK